jgi:hypothetical protein
MLDRDTWKKAGGFYSKIDIYVAVDGSTVYAKSIGKSLIALASALDSQLLVYAQADRKRALLCGITEFG